MSRIRGKQLDNLTVTSEKVDGSVLSTNVPARSNPGAAYNALGEKISNVGAPVAGTDAARLADLYKTQATVVFRPGVASSGIYYQTWSEVEAQINAADGNVLLLVDSSVATATVPNTTDLDGKNLLVIAAYSITNNPNDRTLSMADGARIRNVRELTHFVRLSGAPTIRGFLKSDASTPEIPSFFITEGASIRTETGATLSPIELDTAVVAPLSLFLMRDVYSPPYDDQTGSTPLATLDAGAQAIFIVQSASVSSSTYFTNHLFGGGSGAGVQYVGDASAPRANVSWNALGLIDPGSLSSQRIDNLANIEPSYGSTASRPTDVVTGQLYYDTDVPGMVYWDGAAWVLLSTGSASISNWKTGARLGTAAALPAYTATLGINNREILTASFPATLSVDGSLVQANDRILVKNETGANAPYNGIYKVLVAGQPPGPFSPGQAWLLERVEDACESAGTIVQGIGVNVAEGATNANTQWVLSPTLDPIVVNTTPLTFTGVQRALVGDVVPEVAAGTMIAPTNANRVQSVQSYISVETQPNTTNVGFQAAQAYKYTQFVRTLISDESNGYLYVGQIDWNNADGRPIVNRFAFSESGRVSSVESCYLTSGVRGYSKARAVREIAQDSSYVYATVWNTPTGSTTDVGQIALIDKNNFSEPAGWANFGTNYRAYSVTADGLGNFYVLGLNGPNRYLKRFSAASVNGQYPENGVGASATLAINANRVRYGNGSLWLTNYNLSQPSLREVDPTGSMSVLQTSTSTDAYSPAVYAFNSVWVVNFTTNEVLRIDPTNVDTIQASFAMPVAAPNLTPAFVSIGPAEDGTPDARIWMSSYDGGYLVINPDDDTISSYIDGNGDTPSAEGLAPINETMYFGDYDRGQLVYAAPVNGTYDLVTGNTGIRYGSTNANIVYRPGQPTIPGQQYSSWEEVAKQIEIVKGAATLWVDCEDADGTFVTALATSSIDGYDRLEIRSGNRGNYNYLEIQDGVELANVAAISGNIEIRSQVSTTPPFTFTGSYWATGGRTIVFSENARIRNLGSTPLYSLGAGNYTFQFQSGAYYETTSNMALAELTSASANVVIQQIDNAQGTTALSAYLLAGVTGTAVIRHDSQSEPTAQPSFSGTLTTVRLDHQELIQPSASAVFPSAPLTGQPHFYTVDGKNYWWNGSSWVTYTEGVIGDNLRATRSTIVRQAVLTGGRNYNYGDIGGLSYNYVSNLAMTTGTGTVAAVYATALLESALYFAGSVGGTPGQLYKFDVASQVATFVTGLSGNSSLAPFGAVAADNPCDMIANENWLNGPLVAALTPKGLFVVYNPPTNAASGKQTIFPPTVADGFLGGRLASPLVDQFDGSKTGIIIATAPNEGKVYFADWNGTTGTLTSQSVGTTPTAICVDADQYVWIVDRSNGDILKFSVPAGTPSLTPVATYNVADAYDIAFDGRHIIVLSTTPTNGLTKLDPATGSVVLQVLDPAPYNDLWQFSSTALGTATARIWWDGEALWAFSNGLGYLLRIDPDTLEPLSNVASVSTGSTYGFAAPTPGISIYADGNSLKSATSHLDGNAAFSSIWRLDTPLQLDNGGTGVNGTVRVATTANINLTGNQTIDGVTTVNYDRVLVKNQTNPAENGVYIAKVGAWYRAPDFANASQMYTAAKFKVTSGTTQANTEWELKNEGSITVGTTSLTFMKKVVDNTWKQAARVASTVNVASISGLLTIDGVTVSAGDRVLLKDQTTASQNGIYVAAAGAWTRAVDFNDSSTVYAGVTVGITEGTVNANTLWDVTTSGTIVVGTTSITFGRIGYTTMISVANLTALGSYSVTGLPAGTLAYVSSLRTLFRLGGLTTADGITVITASGGTASWFRLSTPLDSTWCSQTTWFIDPSGGVDENSGSANNAALKTWAEFCRRVPSVNVAMTVTFYGAGGGSVGNTSEWLVGSFKKGSDSAQLIVRGQLTTDANSTIASVTDPVQSGAQAPGKSTVNATIYSGNEGKLLKSAVSGVETFTPLLAVDPAVAGGNGTGSLNSFWATRALDYSLPTTPGTISVVSPSTAPTLQIRTEGFICRAEYFHFTDTTQQGAPFIDTGIVDEPTDPVTGALWGFYACMFDGNISNSPGASSYVVACSFTNATPGNIGRLNPMGGSLLFRGGGSRRLLLNQTNPGRCSFAGFIQYGQVLGFGLTAGSTPMTVEVPNANYTLGVFNSGSDGLILRGNAVLLRATTIFGSGNAGYGLKVDYGAQATFSGLPTITSSAANKELVISVVQGSTQDKVVVLTAGIPSGAPQDLFTWTRWDSVFSRYAVNLCDGSRITKATGIA